MTLYPASVIFQPQLEQHTLNRLNTKNILNRLKRTKQMSDAAIFQIIFGIIGATIAFPFIIMAYDNFTEWCKPAKSNSSFKTRSIPASRLAARRMKRRQAIAKHQFLACSPKSTPQCASRPKRFKSARKTAATHAVANIRRSLRAYNVNYAQHSAALAALI